MQAFIWSKYNKTVILWDITTIKNTFFLFESILKQNLFLWRKAEFSASLLQSSVSHDHSQIILICCFAMFRNIDYQGCLIFLKHFFCENWEFQDFWWIESLKEQHLFNMEIFCNNLTATFYLSSEFDEKCLRSYWDLWAQFGIFWVYDIIYYHPHVVPNFFLKTQ